VRPEFDYESSPNPGRTAQAGAKFDTPNSWLQFGNTIGTTTHFLPFIFATHS
jgi:hypothetical protein